MNQIIITGAESMEKSEDYSRKTINARFQGGKSLEASDGYHTFTELYDHRIALFIALCKNMHELLGMENPGKYKVWKSRNHSDGELCFGDGTWFVMGIGTKEGEQITYHLPMKMWEFSDFAEQLEKAPEYDGHTPGDVVERIKNL